MQKVFTKEYTQAVIRTKAPEYMRHGLNYRIASESFSEKEVEEQL